MTAVRRRLWPSYVRKLAGMMMVVLGEDSVSSDVVVDEVDGRSELAGLCKYDDARLGVAQKEWWISIDVNESG